MGSWNRPSYDFSPDGAWVAYAIEDDDFNRDVFLRKADGSGEPFNLSRHPDQDSDPVWSPDGRLLAFTGRRSQEDSDLHYVWLRKADEEKTKRDRTLKKALEKMKGRDKPAGKAKKKPGLGLARLFKKQPQNKEKKPKPVRIDFDGLTDRIHRISIPDTSESGLMWSPDSKKLAFRAGVNGRDGLYTVAPPDDPKPRLLTTSVGSGGRWLEEGKQIVWLWNGRPATVSSSGKTASFPFRVRKTVDLRRRNLAAFDVAWRTIGDYWYDPALNNRDWNAIRAKYRGTAAQTLTADELDTVVSLMLGELNGSHLGFSARDSWEWRAPGWQPVTAHLGARFDRSWRGPGLRVKDVVEGTPAWRAESRLRAGEIVLSVDGRELDPKRDPTELLTGRLDRDLRLRVRGTDGKERDVTLRPTSYGDVRGKLYEQWLKRNRTQVDERSAGSLGYLHVRGMSWRSFERFEAELYRIGHGKDGLVVDVRDNGGGYTTDHLLTCLTQPVHARTRARGGGPGYPQGRMVYARWSKPIVVLCNQNSFSNAEIFAHAIRTLRRGRIVGVRTAGGVVSTGGAPIMGFANLRLPFRGWFVLEDGADMELNGCRPHVTIWPRPGELPAGVDRQLEKAVELLAEDVAAWKRRPDPDPVPRSAR